MASLAWHVAAALGLARSRIDTLKTDPFGAEQDDAAEPWTAGTRDNASANAADNAVSGRRICQHLLD